MNVDFFDYIKLYKKTIPILIGSAIISYFAVFHSNIIPPIHNRDAIFFVSIIIETSAIVKVYRSKLVKSHFSVSLLVFFLALYFSLHTFMTFKIPTSNLGELDVKGFVCSKKAESIYKDECPFLPIQALQEASFDPSFLWQEWSIAISKVVLVILWSLFIWFASINIASLVFYLNKVKVRKKI